MQRLVFIIAGVIIVGSGVLLGLAAFAADVNQPEQDVVSSPPFQPGRMAHETQAELQIALPPPDASDVEAAIESVSGAPATRSSFMATWNDVSGAKGYLLDVSTNDSFSSYVEGYHDLDVGNVTGRVVTGLLPGTNYYYRVRSYSTSGSGRHSEAMPVMTVPTTGLTIHPTFDGSITSNPNAAAIEAAINRAISIYESLFSDPITIQIRFRYATNDPDGTNLTGISHGITVVYPASWASWIGSLRGDATSSNDSVAIASLPGTQLSSTIIASSANGRALGRNTPPAMLGNGTIGQGGPYDGIVTLNSARPFQFNRPTNTGKFDAQRSIEQEIDEIMGLLHNVNIFMPDDLFSWSSAGHRNVGLTGTRYFSINGGVRNIINFNQGPNGDLGGWQSSGCPQAHPFVQNAFPCAGQFSDISETSPEGINLDVIGYSFASASTKVPSDFNNDRHSDYLLYNVNTRQTVIWYMNDNVRIDSTFGPTLPGGWQVAAVEDFNRDSHPDYLLFNSATRQTVIWYMNNNVRIGSTYGATPPGGWSVVAAADFNLDGYPDYLLNNSNTGGTVIWYMRDSARIASRAGPALPGGWQVAGIADFNRDGHPDYLLFNSATRQTVIWYMNDNVRLGSTYGPTPPTGWSVVGAADFNLDGPSDYLLYNVNTHQTVIWYMNNNVRIGSTYGPTLPGGWSLVAP
jgi:FG-GAP-like repeat